MEINVVEYSRINGEMEDLRSKRSVVSDAEITRRETLSQMSAIDKVLRRMKGLREFLKICS